MLSYISGSVDEEWCLRCLLLVMCTYPFAKKALTLHLARGESLERYFGCNLMQRKVLASSHQHLMAEAPARIPRASKLLICGLFLKGRVLAQDGKAKLPEHSRSVSRPFEADEFRTSSPDRHGWIRFLPEGHPSLLRASVSLRPGPQDAQERLYHQGRTQSAARSRVAIRRRAQ